jgi:hypothetical protein
MDNVEKIRRELRRKSLDQLKIYNPLDTAFQTVWEGFTYVANPKQETVMLRYIAEKWMREFVDYMINKEEQDAVDAENDKRRKKGWEPMNPQERDQFDLRNKYMTNDPDKRLQFMKMVYRGLSQEHGLDLPEPTAVKRDIRPQDEKILEMLDKEMGVRNVLPEDNFDIEDAKDELLKEVSDE